MMEEDQEQRLGWFDLALVGLFLIGIYQGITVHITTTIPFPAAPAGIVGIVLLWRQRNRIAPSYLAALFGVVILYLGSILSATNIDFLPKRFTGLVQLTYSLVLGFALFITLTQGHRRQLAPLFLGFCIAIVVGCLLEDYGGLRALSDKVRLLIYSSGIYDFDLRDELLYGRIRPKLFTSEPSAVTFAYTLYSFGWLMFSEWRWRLLGYLALMAVGMFAMPGPTLLLMMALVIPYLIFLSGQAEPWNPVRLISLTVICGVVVAAFVVVGTSVYGERLQQLSGGKDASFFFRETGPALVTRLVIKDYPIAGAGLTGEPFIANQVINVFARSREFTSAWDFKKVSDALVNYFWLHWIYLGLVWGVIAAAGVTAWLKVLGVPSAAFCWLVWAVLGQASGAYVGPKTWFVLFLAAAGSVLHRRAASAIPQAMYESPPSPFRLPPIGVSDKQRSRWQTGST